jgi:hypothetical protein
VIEQKFGHRIVFVVCRNIQFDTDDIRKEGERLCENLDEPVASGGIIGFDALQVEFARSNMPCFS